MTATQTSSVWTEVAPRPEPKRDRFGRYLIEGKAYTRVTTFAESVDDRYNLELWKQRMVALGIASRPDLYAQVASTPDTDRATLNKLCAAAVEAAKGSAGANLGTALHRFTERIDAGEPLSVPAPWDADLAAYQAVLAEHGVVIDRDLIERVVVVDELELAGTFDRLVTLPDSKLPVIADLKTGATLDFSWSAIAIQLSCYANASRIYDIASDSTVAMPEVDRTRALVIHLPAGQANCTLYTVDIEAGWEAAQLCRGVRSWRKRKNLAVPYVPATPADDPDDRVAWLRRRVQAIVQAGHGDTLASRWPDGVPTLRQGEHDDEQVSRVAAVCDEVEAVHEMPFGDPDPYVKHAQAAARRLRDEGSFDKELIRALHTAYPMPAFTRIAAGLIDGTSALRIAEDGTPSVFDLQDNTNPNQQDKEPTP